MNTTITVELGGKRFTLDESAYRALRSYLDRASARLGGHPDRADVLAGLERSIAAKLERRAPAGGVCDEAVLIAALGEVGRVDGPDLGRPEDGEPEPSAAAGNDTRWRTRRLYRLRDGKIAGVCAGLAAFAEIDVGIVRLLFIVAALFSFGLLLAVYVVLMFVLPVAHTDEEIAAAHGGRRNDRHAD
jgi:phage shock protein PspC (stress-responsive transcriptional regulator)